MKRKWYLRPVPSALALVLVWLLYRLAFLSMLGVPQPHVHDEFSYLLGADTFAHGRLANSQHPLAKFLESPQELVRPTYASKYPPGQAMFLALGQVVFGKPFYGVLIGNALMLFAICTTLFAWVEPKWAWAGSMMPFLCLSPRMYWTNSYWGGSVAATGAAFVLLGIGSYRNSQRWYSGVIFATGALLLFWTRPYEGGVFTIAVFLVFAAELWRKRRMSAVVTVVLPLVIGATWTCYDNKAVTGHYLRLPYIEHELQYSVTPVFWFLPVRPQPEYEQPRLAALHGANGGEILHYRFFKRGWMAIPQGLLWGILSLYIAPVMILICATPFGWRDSIFRKMAIVLGIFLLALATETFHALHYAAPIWVVLSLMIAIWASRASSLRILGLPAGGILTVLVLLAPLSLAFQREAILNMFAVVESQPRDWMDSRAALIERLTAEGTPQLVIVRYPSPDWRAIQEWVYNGADIDTQHVVFAHDMGTAENQALLAYYPNRTPWLLTFDPISGKNRIEPYPAAAGDNAWLRTPVTGVLPNAPHPR